MSKSDRNAIAGDQAMASVPHDRTGSGRSRRVMLVMLGLLGAACGGAGAPQQPAATPHAGGAKPGIATGVWRAPAGAVQEAIWPGPAPDGTYRQQPPEQVQTYDDLVAAGGTSQVVLNVAVPTMTIMPATTKPTGVAVIVFPGGGFEKVFVDLEGTEICRWLTAKGITCILSKYRAPGGNDFYDSVLERRVTPPIPRALQDAQRTIRLVRSRAKELGIDPHRIGVLGMSAGGFLVAQTSNIFTPTYHPVDAIDRISSRPDFAIALYPGHMCRDGKFDRSLTIVKNAPPTFIVQAWDDPVDPVCNSLTYAAELDRAGVSTELHLFAKGGHAFALRHGAEPVGLWPRLVELWLGQLGVNGRHKSGAS